MIAELLKHGEEHALTAEEIGRITGLTPREIRREVARERLEGELILSGRDGYYLPPYDPEEARQEVRRFALKIRKQAQSLADVAEAMLTGGAAGLT